MEKLSDNRFEKRLKRIAKILNSDRFHFSFIGNSVSMYDELGKIIKIITNKQGVNDDRQWQLDRLKILDSVITHISKGIQKRNV
jgi:hypothetical protein|tara:strand:- start:4514 stop:4765 length:252 start_codon:yes stop_codon:yes gene_type:complete